MKPPTDEEAEAAFAEVVRVARDAGLLIAVNSCLASIATPTEQRRCGIRNKVLAARGFEEEPEVPVVKLSAEQVELMRMREEIARLERMVE